MLVLELPLDGSHCPGLQFRAAGNPLRILCISKLTQNLATVAKLPTCTNHTTIRCPQQIFQFASPSPAEMDNSSSSGSESVSGAGEWLDVESDMGEQVTIVSLLDGTTFPDAASMLEDCKRRHGFDFIATCRTLALDFHNSVKLINFGKLRACRCGWTYSSLTPSNLQVRQCGRDGRALPPSISLEDFQDDKYLKPVIEDDALIFCLDELVEEPGEATSSPPSGQAPLQLAGNALQVRNAVLEEELERVKTKFANYRLAVEETLDQRWGEDKPNAAAASLPANGETKGQDSDGYFEAYSYNGMPNFGQCARALAANPGMRA